MYSPAPQTTAKRPLGLCCKVCGNISQLPKSLIDIDSRSPSLDTAKSEDCRCVVWISLWRDQITFPEPSMLAAGSSRPTYGNENKRREWCKSSWATTNSTPNLYDNGALVVAQSNAIGSPMTRDCPDAFHAVIQRIFKAKVVDEMSETGKWFWLNWKSVERWRGRVWGGMNKLWRLPKCIGVPHAHCAIFRSREDDWQFWMENGNTDILRVAFECLDARHVLVVPDFYKTVIRAAHHIRLLPSSVVIDPIDSSIVAREGEVGHRWPQIPHFNGLVQRGWCESIGVFGVESDTHDVVGVAFKTYHILPILVPVPQFNLHIIGTGEDERECWMDGNATNIVQMRFKRVHLEGSGSGGESRGRNYLFARVVVENANIQVIRSHNDPILARNELGCSSR